METCKIWFEKNPHHAQIIEDIRQMTLDGGGKIYEANAPGAIVGVYMYANGNIHWVRENRNKFNQTPHTEKDITDIFPPPKLKHGQRQIKFQGQIHARLVQEQLFTEGFKWANNTSTVQFQDKAGVTIFPDQNNVMGYHEYWNPLETSILYLSQFLISHYNADTVKVQGPHQSESGSTGCSPIRFQGRGCKITTGQRYTGYPAKYYPRRAGISTGKIIGAVPKPSYPGRFDKAKGFEGGLGPTPQAERGAVLDGPYERFKRKYATGNSEVDF